MPLIYIHDAGDISGFAQGLSDLNFKKKISEFQCQAESFNRLHGLLSSSLKLIRKICHQIALSEGQIDGEEDDYINAKMAIDNMFHEYGEDVYRSMVMDLFQDRAV